MLRVHRMFYRHNIWRAAIFRMRGNAQKNMAPSGIANAAACTHKGFKITPARRRISPLRGTRCSFSRAHSHRLLRAAAQNRHKIMAESIALSLLLRTLHSLLFLCGIAHRALPSAALALKDRA